MSNNKYVIVNPDIESNEVYSAKDPEKAAKKAWRKHKHLSIIMIVESGQTSPIFTYFPKNWVSSGRSGKKIFKDNKQSYSSYYDDNS